MNLCHEEQKKFKLTIKPIWEQDEVKIGTENINISKPIYRYFHEENHKKNFLSANIWFASRTRNRYFQELQFRNPEEGIDPITNTQLNLGILGSYLLLRLFLE